MGPLTLPDSGTVYLDSSGLIYSVERIQPYHALLEPIWRQAHAGQFAIVTSELAVLETLVKPIRESDAAVERLFGELFNSKEVTLIPATRQLWEEAARLRATTGLKTADALHAATALLTGCALFITNDSDFRRVGSLPAVILHELL